MKECTRCHLVLPVSHFSFRNTQKRITHTICKLCYNEMRRKWYSGSSKEKARVRAQKGRYENYNRMLIARYKQLYGCTLCLESYGPIIELHHVLGKDYHVSTQKKRSPKALIREMRRCIPVCPSCHAKCHDPHYEWARQAKRAVSVGFEPTIIRSTGEGLRPD